MMNSIEKSRSYIPMSKLVDVNLIPDDFCDDKFAITFDNAHLYDVGGVMNEANNGIRNCFCTIANVHNHEIKYDINNPISVETVHNNLECIIGMVISNFIQSVNNIYQVWLYDIDRMIRYYRDEYDIIGIDVVHDRYLSEVMSSLYFGGDLFNMIIENFDRPESELNHYILSVINKYGSNIYDVYTSYMMPKIMAVFSSESAKNFYEEFNRRFAMFMYDLSYETAVFENSLFDTNSKLLHDNLDIIKESNN